MVANRGTAWISGRMMRNLTRPFTLLCLLAATPATADDITVFAAASLQTALDRVAADWAADTGNRVIAVYDGSGRLARQIAQGAPADIFISASPDWMDSLEIDKTIVPSSRRDILGNALVLIAPAGATIADPLADLMARLGDGKLAMGNVDTVPAGVYGKAALTSLGLWEAVAPHVAQTDSVRAALALVSLGEASMGIVYASDAMADKGVQVIAIFPDESHPPIIYPAALTGDAGPAAQAFLDYLSTPLARAVFVAEGFAGAPK